MPTFSKTLFSFVLFVFVSIAFYFRCVLCLLCFAFLFPCLCFHVWFCYVSRMTACGGERNKEQAVNQHSRKCLCFVMVCYVMFLIVMFMFNNVYVLLCLCLVMFMFCYADVLLCLCFVMKCLLCLCVVMFLFWRVHVFVCFTFKGLQTVISRMTRVDQLRNKEQAICQHSRKCFQSQVHKHNITKHKHNNT